MDRHRAGIETALSGIADEVAGDDAVSRAVRYALGGGGKRLRPVLCLAAMAAVSREPAAADRPAALRAAAAIELVHTYSLVHDDLPCMDDDVLRRGRETTHRVFGTTTAILAGFALVPLACRILADAADAIGATPDARQRVVAELCAGAGAAGMVGGQLLDLDAEREPVGMAALRRIHALKTGALFRASLRIGALLAAGTADEVTVLGHFGERLGMAFQITDDVLDETVDADALGKTPGKDRDAGKVTFVSALGASGARRAACAESAAAIALLAASGIRSELLNGLARFAVDRDR